MKKKDLTWRQAFKKTNVEWVLAAVLLMSALSIQSKEMVGLYWALFVGAGYVFAVYGTRKHWRGFV